MPNANDRRRTGAGRKANERICLVADLHTFLPRAFLPLMCSFALHEVLWTEKKKEEEDGEQGYDGFVREISHKLQTFNTAKNYTHYQHSFTELPIEN